MKYLNMAKFKLKFFVFDFLLFFEISGFFLLSTLTDVCNGEAKFINHYPLDGKNSEFDYDYPTNDEIFDADVKIPGRHMPKLPYYHPNRNDFSSPDLYYYGGSHRSSNFYQTSHSHYGQRSRDYNDDEGSIHTGDVLQQERTGPVVRRTISHKMKNTGYGINSIKNEPLPGVSGPSFDRTLPRNITVQAGKTAVLSCRVLHRGDKTVSWIRHDDLHILTVDKYKYSTDQRVSVVFNEANQEWVLRIRSAQESDAGRYECQISTKPVISFIVSMAVVDYAVTTAPPQPQDMPIEDPYPPKIVPKAHILNGPEIYVHRGSLINLTCEVTHGTEKPIYILWYHKGVIVDYSDREGVTVQTQTMPDTRSFLLVENAVPTDNGKYTCQPSNGQEATVLLHVLSDQRPAAMHSNSSAPIIPAKNYVFSTFIYFFIVGSQGYWLC